MWTLQFPNLLLFSLPACFESIESPQWWFVSVHFCLQVFALGNKTYEHYNAMGKYVDKRLEELGAKRIFDLGLGDDDGK